MSGKGFAQWQAYCRYTGGSGWFKDGWYPAVDESHARILSTDGKIRSREIFRASEWVES